MDLLELLKLGTSGAVVYAVIRVAEALFKHLRASTKLKIQVKKEDVVLSKEQFELNVKEQDFANQQLRKIIVEENDRWKRRLDEEEQSGERSRKAYTKLEIAFQRAKEDIAAQKIQNIILTAQVNQCHKCPQVGCPVRASLQQDQLPSRDAS